MPDPVNPLESMTGPLVAVSVALEERDPKTQRHCERVRGLAHELGRACGLSERELRQLDIAAGFHDVGKIGIPDDVLRKQGELSESDWVVMKTHSERSERIIAAAALPDGDAIARAARHHHERIDGTGYPDGLAGEAIPVLSRLIAIADTYDAMARLRPYAMAKSHAEIMLELFRVRGHQLDAYMVARLASFIERSQFRTT